MAGKRIARLNEQFRREVTQILRTEVRDPRVGLPTVTGAEVTPDLWMARIFVRPGLTREDEGELLEGLEAAAPFIRRRLGDLLTLRRVPELRFELDRTLERAERIESILREVIPPGQREGGAEAEEDEEDELDLRGDEG